MGHVCSKGVVCWCTSCFSFLFVNFFLEIIDKNLS